MAAGPTRGRTLCYVDRSGDISRYSLQVEAIDLNRHGGSVNRPYLSRKSLGRLGDASPGYEYKYSS